MMTVSACTLMAHDRTTARQLTLPWFVQGDFVIRAT
uniref:Uncharacterized protein n=1 Tax=Anguilla anguilla TaxID=7936 RepID=A0A0E9P8Z1_ANGAN